MRRPRRGAAFLEFVLLLPFLVILMMLTLDTGRLVLAIGSLQDATAASARAAARVGYTGAMPSSEPCEDARTPSDVAHNAFCEAARGLPFLGNLLSLGVVSEPTHFTSLGYTCSITETNSEYMRIAASSTVDLMTPLLRSFLGLENEEGSAVITATAVARCEVAR